MITLNTNWNFFFLRINFILYMRRYLVIRYWQGAKNGIVLATKSIHDQRFPRPGRPTMIGKKIIGGWKKSSGQEGSLKYGLFIRGSDWKAIYQRVNRASNVSPAPLAKVTTTKLLVQGAFVERRKCFPTFQSASRGGGIKVSAKLRDSNSPVEESFWSGNAIKTRQCSGSTFHTPVYLWSRGKEAYLLEWWIVLHNLPPHGQIIHNTNPAINGVDCLHRNRHACSYTGNKNERVSAPHDDGTRQRDRLHS